MDVDIVAIGDCACVAFDSALRGLKVVAIEERDFVRGVSFNLGTSLDFFRKGMQYPFLISWASKRFCRSSLQE